MTTALKPAARRTGALAKAEITQFFRNNTLVFMGTIFPALFAVTLYYITDFAAGDAVPQSRIAAGAMEIFLLLVVTFVQFYSVLSMTTTRRDENVLKRLRTGEATDANILTAIAVPGALLSVISFALFTAGLWALSGTAPTNVAVLAAGLVLGLVVCTGLALVTSAYTRNAESAQVTSMPVIGLAMASQAQIRQQMPDGLADVVAWTPFAALSDMAHLGWSGATAAGEHPNLLEAAAQPAIVLVLWSAIALMWAKRAMRWDTHRG